MFAVATSCRRPAASAGRQTLTVLVTVLEGFELRMTFDPETNMALLQPQEEMSHV